MAGSEGRRPGGARAIRPEDLEIIVTLARFEARKFQQVGIDLDFSLVEIRAHDQGLGLGRQVGVKLGDQDSLYRPENQSTAPEEEQREGRAKQKRRAAPPSST